MPSKKSYRTSVKNAEYNRPIASRAKTLLRNSLELIEENKDKDQIQKSYKEAISALINACSALSPASIKPARVLYIFSGKNLFLPSKILSSSCIKVIIHGEIEG